MTTRHCVIGDSHIAALKQGWDDIRDECPGHDIVFFGARVDRLRALSIDGASLTATSDPLRRSFQRTAGTDRIAPAAFDMVWLVGCAFNPQRIVNIYRHFRSEAHVDRGSRAQLISDIGFTSAVAGAVDAGVSARLLEAISAMEVPVGLVAAPWISHQIVERDRVHAQLAASPDGESLRTAFECSLGRVAEQHGSVALPQIQSTLASPVTTHSRFATSSVGLRTSGIHGEGELHHMNEAYGRHMIRAMIATA